MGTKTLFRRLISKLKPGTETEWIETNIAGHKLRGVPGDDSWAKAKGQQVKDIREGRVEGDSGIFRVPFCSPCKQKGVTVLLLENREQLWCGCCGWIRPERKFKEVPKQGP